MKDLLPWKKRGEGLLHSRRKGREVDMMHRKMDDLFEDFFEGFEDMFSAGLLPLMRREPAWLTESPSFEVSETDDELRVQAELPGMDEKDIEVDLEGSELTIRGEKKREHEEKRRDYRLSEMTYGQFSRTFKLPEGIDRDKAKAQFKKGVLTLTMPKTEKVKAERRHIAIEG